jgi:hypothetical protein
MHIVEPDSDSIIADGINGENGHVALAADRFAFRFGMTLHFGGWAGDAEQFRRETERLAIVKRDLQGAAVLRKPDFNRPRRVDTGHIQGTDLFIPFFARPMPKGILSGRANQITAGIANPGSAGREGDGARLLNAVEQY